jgi:uncharacterized protein (DUF58 family)
VTRPQPWLPTHAHIRASLLGVGLVLLGLLARRPDLVVVAVPLVIVAVWSAATRPHEEPRYKVRIEAERLREGEATVLSVLAAEQTAVWDVAVVVPANPWLETQPGSGAVLAGHERPAVDVVIRTMRWGEREVGPLLVAASSAWGSYRWGPVLSPARAQVTLPIPAVFDAHAPTPHPSGLVGINRSRRSGEGSEFASIRQFHAGDRLRRINWRVSSREQELHVSSTYADQDSHVVLVVDATNDIGLSEGVSGLASSLDIGVRAAGAIAEHFLRRGDRVGLRILGKGVRTRLPSAAGRAHLERLLDTLATVTAGSVQERSRDRFALGIEAGGLVLVLSPLMSRTALEQALSLRRSGLTVVVVDTLPEDFVTGADDPMAAVARRVRLLERDAAVASAHMAGIPVTAWRGSGSLDPILRDLSRRAAAPRLVRR